MCPGRFQWVLVHAFLGDESGNDSGRGCGGKFSNGAAEKMEWTAYLLSQILESYFRLQKSILNSLVSITSIKKGSNGEWTSDKITNAFAVINCNHTRPILAMWNPVSNPVSNILLHTSRPRRERDVVTLSAGNECTRDMETSTRVQEAAADDPISWKCMFECRENL